MNNIQPYSDSPVLLDKVIQRMRKSLLEELPWLNQSFGKAFLLYDNASVGSKFGYPAAYIGNGEYLSLLPNDQIGNFSWFDFSDPQAVKHLAHLAPTFTANGYLVFWYNIESIFDDTLCLHTEDVKKQVLDAMLSPAFLPSGCSIELKEVYDKPESIYKGYAAERPTLVQPLDRQFLVYPYFGLRINFTLKMKSSCKL